MKIAILHTGHVRTYERCINNWKLAIKSRYDADFYFGVWNERGTKLDKTGDNARPGLVSPTYSAVVDRTHISKEELIETLCPNLTTEDKVLYLNHEEHHKIIMDYMVHSGAIDGVGNEHYAAWLGEYNGKRITTTCWHQWYMVRETYKLVEQSGVQYDLIIRTRMDTAWVGYPNFGKYEAIQIPFRGANCPHDYLSYGPQNMMSKMCNMYDYLAYMYHNKYGVKHAGLDAHDSVAWMAAYVVPVQNNQENLMSVIRKDLYPSYEDVAFLLEKNHSDAWRNCG